MSDLVPEGWVQTRIGKVSKLQGGYAFKSTDSAESGIRWLKIANVGIGRVKWADKSFLPKSFESQYADFILNDGDSVVALTRPIIGGELKVAQIGGSDTPALLNQRVARINPNPKLINRDFLYSLFRYEQISKEIVITIYGTDPPNVSTKQIEDIKFHLPPLPEQQKIAAILSSVDEVIEKTQAQINKLKDLKTGMMQELLSPREGKTANKNNPQGESRNGLHHTEFKDSPLGRIPVGWEVVDANSVCSKITKGTTPPKSEYTNDNKIPFLRVNNLYFDNKIHFEKGVLFLSRSIQDGFLARSIVYPEDILMNIVGPPLSKIAIVPNDYSEYNVNQAIVIYRTVKKKIHNRYFMHYLTSNKAQNWLKTRSKKTSGQQNLTIELCKDLPVPLPSIDKQVQITNVLDGIDSLLTKKQERHSQLNNVKKALMQDLLTGKVRVQVDEA
jgi:type I restriction enzyme S subunit